MKYIFAKVIKKIIAIYFIFIKIKLLKKSLLYIPHLIKRYLLN